MTKDSLQHFATTVQKLVANAEGRLPFGFESSGHGLER